MIEGQDAKILVNYGGVDVMIERSSNTFNLEGLTVTVSGLSDIPLRAAASSFVVSSIDFELPS